MTFPSKRLAALWDNHPIALFFPSFGLLLLSALFASSNNPFLHASISLFLLFTGLYLALYVNASIDRGYIALDRAYRWEAPINFWGICCVYGILSFLLIIASIFTFIGVIWS